MRNKNHILKLVLIGIILLSLSMPLPAYGESFDVGYFLQIKNLIQKNYVYDIGEQELIEGAIKGLFYHLDENSGYYTKEEFDGLLQDITGDFVGIGVYIGDKDGQIVIVDTIKNGPAHKAGMKAEDIILNIDGKDVKNLTLDEVIKLIQGKEGSKVNIMVERGQGKKLKFTLNREKIKINPVDYKIIDKNIGYIRLNQFSQNSCDEIVLALKEFDKKNISNIIIDLRDNPGGLLDQAVNISKLFIPEGPIVHIKFKGGKITTYYSSLKKPKYNLSVIVNENSASASEIFAGAVQDRKAGKIVGVTTYGKGTVQQLVSLPNGDGMKLTIAEYLTPNKRNINKKGIVPDIVVENKGDKDLQLEKAIQSFKN